ncbi:MAG: DUF302 domain-containing protein [Candidatus Krumholzibacteriia bacterium]
MGFFFGLLVGCALAAVVFVTLMRKRMLAITPSRFATVEETVTALEQGIAAAAGWNSPATRDLNGMLAKHGVTFAPKVRLVEMCKASYAAEVLQDARAMATLMPCALAVYADDTGKVWISRLNTGLMAKMFGGTVARVMGGGVAVEEEAILRPLVS